MKNYFLLPAVLLALAVVACKSVNKEVLSNLEKDNARLQTLAPQTDSLLYLVNGMFHRFREMGRDTTVKRTDELRELLHVLPALLAKAEGFKAEVQEMQQKASAALADYKAGKLSEEEAKAQEAKLAETVQGYEDSMKSINEFLKTPLAVIEKAGGKPVTPTAASPNPSDGSLQQGGGEGQISK